MENPDFFNLIYDALDEKLLHDEAVAAQEGSKYDSSDLTSTDFLSPLFREELADNKENGTLNETDLRFRNRAFQSEFEEPTSSELPREVGAYFNGSESPGYLADTRPRGGKKTGQACCKERSVTLHLLSPFPLQYGSIALTPLEMYVSLAPVYHSFGHIRTDLVEASG